jgi:hypothetical protein
MEKKGIVPSSRAEWESRTRLTATCSLAAFSGFLWLLSSAGMGVVAPTVAGQSQEPGRPQGWATLIAVRSILGRYSER